MSTEKSLNGWDISPNQQENAGNIAEYKKQYAKTPKGKAVSRASRQNRRAANFGKLF